MKGREEGGRAQERVEGAQERVRGHSEAIMTRQREIEMGMKKRAKLQI